jgi:hypothetical protein
MANVGVFIFLFSSLTFSCCFITYYLLYNSFKVVGVFKIVNFNSIYALDFINTFKLVYAFPKLRNLFTTKRSSKSLI